MKGVTAPRVLHLMRTWDPESGGALSYVRAAALALADTPVRNFLAVVHDSGPTPADWPVRFPGGGANAFRRWLGEHVHEYDLLHMHGVFSWPLFAGARAGRRHGVPYVVSTHGHLYPWSLSQKSLRKRAYLSLFGARSLRCAAALVATADEEARIAVAAVPGVHTAVARPGIAMPAAISLLDAPDDALRVVFLGRLAPQKGVPVLLEALAELRARGVPALLELAGSGEPVYERQLRDQAARLGVDARFLGHQDASGMAAALGRAHVFALASHMENFSFATAEALAAGMPVVLTSEVALSDLVQRHQCGSVVPPSDPAALAVALTEYRNPARRRDAGRRARACAESELSLPRMGTELRHLYESACKVSA